MHRHTNEPKLQNTRTQDKIGPLPSWASPAGFPAFQEVGGAGFLSLWKALIAPTSLQGSPQSGRPPQSQLSPVLADVTAAKHPEVVVSESSRKHFSRVAHSTLVHPLFHSGLHTPPLEHMRAVETLGSKACGKDTS